MRLSTLVSVAVIGLSGAALAQVTQPSVEQKLGNDVAVAENVSAPPAQDGDAAPANMMSTPSGNTVDAAPPAGERPEGSATPRSR